MGLKIFLLIESVLLLFTFYQLFRDFDLLLVIVGGIILLKISDKKKKRTSLFRWIGWFMIISSLLSVFTAWIMVAFALLFFIFQGSHMLEDLNVSSLFDVPWKKKNYIGVEVKEPIPEEGIRRKQQWIGNKTIGSTIFEWDDINISVLMGDTIIDLGNTLLPDEQNVILIRKGLGHTKVIVPIGVGVFIQHSVLQGKLGFDGEKYQLSNETITLSSEDYHTATRKIKILSNVLIGDLEVIYL